MVDFKRSLAGIQRDIKKPVEDHGIVLPSVGIATGIFAGTFLSEMTARTLGYLKYKKAAVKSGVKVALGTLFFGAGVGFPSASFILYPAAIGTWGMIPFDWIEAKWSGGVTGFAEKAAVTIRTWSMGVEKVQKEIAAIEGLNPNVIIETGGEFHVPFENTHTKSELELRGAPLQPDHATPPEALRAESPLGMRLTKS